MTNNQHNKINIKTKYNIEDKVWFADYFYDTFYPCKYSGEIFEISIEITKTHQHICYWMIVDYGDCIRHEKHYENECFNSYEECTKWCNKRNK